MYDLLSKEHYCYKTHLLPMKSSAKHPFPSLCNLTFLYMDYSLLKLYENILAFGTFLSIML